MSKDRPLRFALASRELYPFGGGGIGEYINSSARLLATIGEVVIFTTSRHAEPFRVAKATGDPRLPPPDVEVVFVPEPRPDEIGGHFSLLHLYSARVLDELRSYYGRRGPDLVEFSDYLGEGAVTAQARRAGEAMLRATRVGVRLHTSIEICTVLDGYLDDAFEARVTYELERLALRDADALLWPGGDSLSLYERFYGSHRLAPGERIRNPFALSGHATRVERPRESPSALRLLYLGRFERRKGVQNLIWAVTSIDTADVQLTLIGGNTDTGPLGTSMRTQLELMAAGDPRIEFLDAVPRTDLESLIREHDVVVLPSLWEAWPYVGLEALRLNRPLLATPTGGFTEMVRTGVSGWCTDDVGVEPLASLIERLVFNRDDVERPRLEGLPAAVFDELTDPTEIVESYRSLVRGPARWDWPRAGVRAPIPSESDTSRRPVVAPGRPPLVSVVIPYYQLDQHVEETVESVFAQTYPRLEVVVVNDGSFREADWVLAELATRYPILVVTQMNAGLGAARNFGIVQSRGRYVVPVDADNTVEPLFIERGLELLESDPDLAYVTAWSRFVDEHGFELDPPQVGYQPLGNLTEFLPTMNVAGDATAVIRRRLFDVGFAYSQDLTSYEDWAFYRALANEGLEGIVIPERLFRYRVRQESMFREIGMPNSARLLGEIDTHLTERRIEWTQRNG